MSLEGLTLDDHGLFTDRPGAIATFSGGRIDMLDPQIEDLSLIDIARGLSNACRWNGQCEFLSVAEHSVMVSLLVPTMEALMHDASEGYASDLARPVKMKTDIGAAYLPLEAKLDEIIAKKFDLEWPWPKSVKEADYAVGFYEAKVLLPHLGDLMPPVEAEMPPIRCLAPNEAMDLFLWRFWELDARRKHPLVVRTL